MSWIRDSRAWVFYTSLFVGAFEFTGLVLLLQLSPVGFCPNSKIILRRLQFFSRDPVLEASNRARFSIGLNISAKSSICLLICFQSCDVFWICGVYASANTIRWLQSIYWIVRDRLPRDQRTNLDFWWQSPSPEPLWTVPGAITTM